jgi:hypothetical protein
MDNPQASLGTQDTERRLTHKKQQQQKQKQKSRKKPKTQQQ